MADNELLPGIKKFPIGFSEDSRGSFRELFRTNSFFFPQVNMSVSKANVFRGLHMQRPPRPQGKLVQVTTGSIRDFVLDPNPFSETYRQFCEVSIHAESEFSLWIPGQYAHGFLSLQEDTTVVYAVDREWSPQHELTINLIGSGIENEVELRGLLRSEKDRHAPRIMDVDAELFSWDTLS